MGLILLKLAILEPDVSALYKNGIFDSDMLIIFKREFEGEGLEEELTMLILGCLEEDFNSRFGLDEVCKRIKKRIVTVRGFIYLESFT